MGYKCSCGRFFMNPLPTTCSKCGSAIPGGCSEGNTYRIISEQPDKSLLHVFTKLGGILGSSNPKVIDKIQLGPDCFVEFLDKWDDGDTRNVPKIVR